MAPNERISLLDARLELTRHLTQDERTQLADVRLPVISVDPGLIELATVLARHKAFGATVLDGIVMNALRIGEHTGIQLLGPGDLLVQGVDPWPSWISDFELRTPATAHLALFGNELLGAAYRWPRIIQGLYMCLSGQVQRLTAQLVICQLPRVDERVLAMLWLLAESWGQVTPAGVRLMLTLTHETLGALVGARRPTVTLALRKLTSQGSILHQESGWLLVEPPPRTASTTPSIIPPERAQSVLSLWARPPDAPPDPSVAYAELKDTVRMLRERHVRDREQLQKQLVRFRTARLRVKAVRQRVTPETPSPREPPSS
jgi:CRP/FNR family transcriptional regulator, cyclic AMP receptor protein